MDANDAKRVLKNWREEHWKDAWKQSLKGSVIVCLFILINGFVWGPIGLAFGGISGGFVAFELTKKSYKSIADVIYDEYNKPHFCGVR